MVDLGSHLPVFSCAQEERPVNRRTFFNAIAASPALGLLRAGTAAAELSKPKIMHNMVGDG